MHAANNLPMFVMANTPLMTEFYTQESSGNHTHSYTTPNHTHEFTVPNHTHDFTVPSHTHKVDIPDHKHNINLPNHTHGIEHGIFKLSTVPSRVYVKVYGNTVPISGKSVDSFELIPYLSVDERSIRIDSGCHEVEITTDGFARCHAQLMTIS